MKHNDSPTEPVTEAGVRAVEKVEALAGWSHISEWRSELVALIVEAEQEARAADANAEIERLRAALHDMVATALFLKQFVSDMDLDPDEARLLKERYENARQALSATPQPDSGPTASDVLRALNDAADAMDELPK